MSSSCAPHAFSKVQSECSLYPALTVFYRPPQRSQHDQQTQDSLTSQSQQSPFPLQPSSRPRQSTFPAGPYQPLAVSSPSGSQWTSFSSPTQHQLPPGPPLPRRSAQPISSYQPLSHTPGLLLRPTPSYPRIYPSPPLPHRSAQPALHITPSHQPLSRMSELAPRPSPPYPHIYPGPPLPQRSAQPPLQITPSQSIQTFRPLCSRASVPQCLSSRVGLHIDDKRYLSYFIWPGFGYVHIVLYTGVA